MSDNMPAEGESLLRISLEEIDQARPVFRPTWPLAPPPPAAAAAARPTSHLAAVSLGLAIAGVPLVGVLLGPVAVLCGAFALAETEDAGHRGGRWALAGIVLGILDFVGWSIGLLLLLSRPASSGQPPLANPSFTAQPALDIAGAPAPIQRALRANVRIECSGPYESSGAGVVVARSGSVAWLATNEHVAHCAAGDRKGVLRVVSSSGEYAAAQIRWIAPHGVDLALLRTKPLPGMGEMKLARRTAKVGDPIFVVGNPLGLDSSYTAGIVSALRSGPHHVRVFQIQASVNHGNSGGGLYTREGEFLGLVTWTADKKVAEGIGFAISASDLVSLLQADQDVWREVSGLSSGTTP
jgi:S1-C subfamily serine protease